MHKRDFTGMGALDAEYHANFCVQRQRELFQAQPPALQRETLARVNRLIAQYPTSYLARHWQNIYRLKGEW